jgi:hypothetical protein
LTVIASFRQGCLRLINLARERDERGEGHSARRLLRLDLLHALALQSASTPITTMGGIDPACAKTPARFHTDLFCSLFRALRPLGSEKIAKIFALRDCLQKFAGFSHGLDPKATYKVGPTNRR